MVKLAHDKRNFDFSFVLSTRISASCLFLLVLKRRSFAKFLYTTSYRFIISYYSSQVRDFEIKAFIKSWFSHVCISSRNFVARKLSLLWAPRLSQRPNFFTYHRQSWRRATSFSQRLLVNLHRYRATIRRYKLPLFQVYCDVSLLPFGARRQPKYISFYCCSYLSVIANYQSFLCQEKVSFSLSKLSLSQLTNYTFYC